MRRPDSGFPIPKRSPFGAELPNQADSGDY
jgi:hypothetical protein